jgi:hypothetical protein
MDHLAFERPIPLRTGELGFAQGELRTVADGIAALSRLEASDLQAGQGRAERAVWTEALYCLWNAKFERTAESVELAHRALHRLVSACGMLGGGGGLPQTVQEHLGQQLRAAYGEAAEKPAFLGDPVLATQFEESLRRLEAAHRRWVREKAFGAVAAALDGGDETAAAPSGR